MAKKKFPYVSIMDMKEIYLKLIHEVGEEFPAVLIFDDKPFDAMRFIMLNGNSVLYFNNCDGICEKIIEEIKKPHIQVEEAPDFMVHSMDDNDVAFLYACATVIAEALDIECPQVEFRDNTGGLHGQSVAERNWVSLQAVPAEALSMILHFMAHEFRHIWQYKYHPEYQQEYVKSEDSVDGYLDCLPENDAEAFAHKIILDVFGIDELEENKDYAGGNKELQNRIKKMRDEIKIDEDAILKLRTLWGIE